MRKQYHLKKNSGAFDAWDVDKLIEKSKDLKIFEKPVAEISEINENFWYQSPDVVPTCKSITEHFKLMNECSLDFPIILDYQGKLMDGMHRVAKAILLNQEKIKAVQFTEFLKPDFKNVQENELSYERS